MMTSSPLAPCLRAPWPGLAGAGLEVDLVGEGLQVAQLRIADDDHVAAPAPVAPVGTAARHVHLPTKRNAAVPAVPGRHMDLCVIEEHGRPPKRRARPRTVSASRYSATMLMTRPALPAVKTTLPGGLGEQGVVGADAHVDARDGTGCRAGARGWRRP